MELDGDTTDRKFMDEIVGMLALEDKLHNMPDNLSGGQQQRVAIARALITEPAIIPFAGTVVPYQFPFLQMGLFLLVLFGMEVVQSVWMVRRQKKQYLLEQMRARS